MSEIDEDKLDEINRKRRERGYHPLTGNRKGTHAVWVTRNQRVTYKWDSDGAFDVDLEDYHER